MKLFICLFTSVSLLILACGSHNNQDHTSTIPVLKDTFAENAGSSQAVSVMDEEQYFQQFFERFCQAVERNDSRLLQKMLHFPLQMAPKWADEDLKSFAVDKNAGKVEQGEFSEYRSKIFTADVRRLLANVGQEELSVIKEAESDDYYQTLRLQIDPHTDMREVYVQYPEPDTIAETYFAFVFARIKGEYKVVSYYGKWPVKD